MRKYRQPITLLERVFLILVAAAIIFVAVLAANVEKADALEVWEVPLEEGATFDGGRCWEADGTEGLAMPDGECRTPADFDIMFGYDNLSTVESQTQPGRSVADVYNIKPEPAASERPLGSGLVEVEERFSEIVYRLHHGLLIL